MTATYNRYKFLLRTLGMQLGQLWGTIYPADTTYTRLDQLHPGTCQRYTVYTPSTLLRRNSRRRKLLVISSLNSHTCGLPDTRRMPRYLRPASTFRRRTRYIRNFLQRRRNRRRKSLAYASLDPHIYTPLGTPRTLLRHPVRRMYRYRIPYTLYSPPQLRNLWSI